ncbi:MAG: sigma-70 family RNA polymerase sigma factor [Myxococcales bacterium]|nr:sigma-70 family RNA polymerase sigma factor [Myxococcales bacterium]
MDERSDEALFEAWQRGDRAALGVLFTRYKGGVTSYARRMLRSHQEAEDVCLEAFQKVLKGGYGQKGSFRAFVFTVAHRLCLDRMRRSTRAKNAMERMPEPTPARSPEESVVHADRLGRLEQAMEGLPEQHRAVLLLYYGQALKTREVAEILGRRHDQARSKIAYACRLLREALTDAEEVPV